MFTEFRQDIASRGRRLHEGVSRARDKHRAARDEYLLAKAERPHCLAQLAGLVARHQGVTLYRDRIEYAGQVHPLAGARAEVVVPPHRRSERMTAHDLVLSISGPGWSLTLPTVAYSSRRARDFALTVNVQAAALRPSLPASRTASATDQFRALRSLRGTGVLTDDEFSVAVGRLREPID
jgi:hypothetical protein